MPPLEKTSYRLDPMSGLGGAVADDDGLLRRVAAGLAHNVNNALAGVISYLELALRESEPGSAGHRRLADGLQCAWRAAESVRRMVAFARRPQIHTRSAVCLRQAADRAARRAADRPGVAVTVRGGDALCPVWANEPMLHLVLEQLVSNAVEAMPAGGPLVLRAWDDGHRRCLSVTDAGPGLSSEVRRHLFEPFFTTKSFGHLGLGLALCRDMIEAQGGALHVSSAEGQGTTVTLSFPPPDEPPAARD